MSLYFELADGNETLSSDLIIGLTPHVTFQMC